MRKENYDYLDIAKGIGILSVVWAHILLTGITHQVIYAFHMPLFFLISGMLFKKDKYLSFREFLVKRFYRLLIPYLAYSFATWIVWVSFRYIRHDEVESYWIPLLQTFYAQGSGAYIVHNSALWFIPCLFATEIMFYFISNTREYVTLFLCFVLCGVSFLFGEIFGEQYWFILPWNLDAAFIALAFYGTGNILMRHYSHQCLISYAANHRWKILFLAFIMFGLLIISSVNYGECSMGSSSYQCNGAVFVLRAFVGCTALLLLSLRMGVMPYCKSLSILRWMGKKSLDVMCLHIPVKGVVMIVVAMTLSTTTDFISEDIQYSLIAFFITMIVVTGAIVIINKSKSFISLKK